MKLPISGILGGLNKIPPEVRLPGLVLVILMVVMPILAFIFDLWFVLLLFAIIIIAFFAVVGFMNQRKGSISSSPGLDNTP